MENAMSIIGMMVTAKGSDLLQQKVIKTMPDVPTFSRLESATLV